MTKPGISTLLPLFVSLSLGFAADLPQPPPDPAKVRQAAQTLADRTAEVQRGAQGLRQSINNAIRELEKLERGKEIDKLRAEARKANDKIKQAAKAVEEAMDASLKCNKEKFAELDEKAMKLIEEANQATDNVEKMDKDLTMKMDDIILKVDGHIQNLKKTGDKEYKDAQDAGLKDDSVAAVNFRRAKQALDKEIEKQQQSIENLDKTYSRIGKKITDIRGSVNALRTLDKAQFDLQDAEQNIKKNCPMRVSGLPQQPVDVFVSVDNRPEVLACIAPGQNPQEAAAALGLAEHQFVASGPTGTIIRGPGDPQTVNRLAQQRRITLCFPAEANVCVIMTPLTPFRGHDHKAHEQSRRGAHDHDAPDPPLDWGVVPPETLIRWNKLSEGQRQELLH